MRRKTLLDHLGGLPETTVENAEWLYMITEETRHSLSIEGFFATEQELKAILKGRKTEPEILNYFRMAQTSYDLALQYYRQGESLRLDLPYLRHIHSELFRELTVRRGDFRRGAIQIQGAKVQPPPFDVDQYLRSFCQLASGLLETQPLLPALARIHTLFESIHPFEDGNGRVGRILLNCLAVNKGYPPIIIKGIQSEERNRYYQALEAADVGFHQGFSAPSPQALQQQLEQGRFQPLEALLYEGLQPRIDRLIAASLQHQEPLLEFKELAPQFGVKEGTLRQWVNRGKLISLKQGNKLYSHPKLYLDAKQQTAPSQTPQQLWQQYSQRVQSVGSFTTALEVARLAWKEGVPESEIRQILKANPHLQRFAEKGRKDLIELPLAKVKREAALSKMPQQESKQQGRRRHLER